MVSCASIALITLFYYVGLSSASVLPCRLGDSIDCLVCVCLLSMEPGKSLRYSAHLAIKGLIDLKKKRKDCTGVFCEYTTKIKRFQFRIFKINPS